VKNIYKKLLSMQAMAVTMLLFALSLAVATFVENDYDTNTAKALVYQAKWFEFLLIYLLAILVANMLKFKMHKNLLSMKFIFHASFVIILLGAAVTRYFGFEGTLHIREGQTENRLSSAVPYLQVKVEDGKVTSLYEKPLLFSKLSSNHFNDTFSNGKHSVELELAEYTASAEYVYSQDPKSDKGLVELTMIGNQGREDISLTEGSFTHANGYVIDFDSKQTFSKPTVRFYFKDGEIHVEHKEAIQTLNMDTRVSGSLNAYNDTVLMPRTLHTIGDKQSGTSFVMRSFLTKARKQLVSMEDQVRSRNGKRYPDALKLNIESNGKTKELLVFGYASRIGKFSNPIEVGGLRVSVNYGAKRILLPFSVKLKDFELERYPGSMAPSSYASEVVLIDNEKNIKQDYRIYMNHVLDHRGYRLFQSSYDQDEMGTVLSVNYDFWGTWITYIGYLLLAFGLFGSFVVKKGRFNNIKRELEKIRAERAALASILVAVLLTGFAPTSLKAEPKLDKEGFMKLLKPVDLDHAKAYGRLLTQGEGGRLEPMELLARKILRKISKRDTFEGMPAIQVVLSIMNNPRTWFALPLIKVDDKQVAERLGLPAKMKYASFNAFYPAKMKGRYLFEMDVDEANRKAPKNRNQYDKKLLKIDERVHITQMISQGFLFKIFPKENDKAQKWYDLYGALGSLMQAEQQASAQKRQAMNIQGNQRVPVSAEDIQAVYPHNADFTLKQSWLIKELFYNYFTSVSKAQQNGDWTDANSALAKIADYQKFAGAAIYSSDFIISMEIMYEKIEIFYWLTFAFIIVGLWLLVVAFVGIIKPKMNLSLISKTGFYTLVFFFTLYTLGLIARWMISGHAPWSNGYEALVFIGWATMVAGFLVSKNSLLTLAATAMLTGITLFVAILSDFDPQITNLVPVLKSYWLTIHVSMITSSYGFLGLAFLLGFISLFLFISLNDNNAKRISLTVKELNRVAEMAVMMGLVLLTVGNFLGGVWANESWGRYWGWDAKETWALISILIYATVAHLRYIPKMYTDFRYSVILVVSYASILMTFFGVNFYLSGLHSYAKGDAVPVPTWVYYAIVTVILLILAAAYKKNRFVK
jgi:cytochrome c-type biogenesis protein CcsB